MTSEPWWPTVRRLTVGRGDTAVSVRRGILRAVLLRLTRESRFGWWTALVLAVAVGMPLWLVLCSKGGDAALASRDGWGIALFLGGWGLLGGAGLAMAYLLRSTPADAIRLPERRSRVYVLGLTAMFLAGGVWLPEPVLSSDYHRFGVEGRMWLSGANPFATTPAQWATTPERQAAIAGISRPDLATIYPTTSQGLFVAAAWLDGVLGWDRSLRLLLAGCALAGVGLLLVLLRRTGASPWWAAVVGFSPLLVAETAWNPHTDMLGAMLVLGALVVLPRHAVAAGLLLAAAGGVKPQVLLAAPFLVRESRRPWLAVLGLGVGLAALVPPLAAPGAWRGFSHCIQLYSTSWEANGGLFEGLKSAAALSDDPRAINRLKDLGRLTGPVLSVLVFWVLWRRQATTVRAAHWLQLTLLLCSPVVYPWYLLWVVTLVPLMRGGGQAGGVWAVTVGLSYLLGWVRPDWSLPGWVLWAEFGPVLAVLLVELFRESPDSARSPGTVAAAGGAPARGSTPGIRRA